MIETLVEESTDVVAVVDADGRFRYVSPAVERLLGYDPETLVGEESIAYVHPEDRGRSERRFADLLDRPDGELTDELRVRHADGSWVWVENRGRNLLDDPEVGGVVVYTRDITRRRERERKRRHHEAILENMEDVAYTVDESLVVTYANARALGYAELPREAVVGQPIADLSERMLGDPAHVERFLATLRAAVDGEVDDERLELDIDLPGGTVVAELQVTPLRAVEGSDADGDATSEATPQGAVVISRDVTSRREHERELERTNERLEAFAGVVSHDLRGPLSVASGNLELARMECESDRLETVAQAHARMDELIENLLLIARQGTPVDAFEAVDLDAVAASCWELIETTDATVDVDTGLVVRADESRLRQLLGNLFRNAVEHGSTTPRSGTHEGPVEHAEEPVTVTVGDLPDGFYVEDDGPGIDPEDRESAFEPGYTTKPGGTGFGLMIIRDIADAHGWGVRVTESASGGARFEIRNVEQAPSSSPEA